MKTNPYRIRIEESPGDAESSFSLSNQGDGMPSSYFKQGPWDYTEEEVFAPQLTLPWSMPATPMQPRQVNTLEQERSASNTQNSATERGATPEEVAQIIDSKLAALKVYVLESEISEAQNRVRSLVELASF